MELGRPLPVLCLLGKALPLCLLPPVGATVGLRDAHAQLPVMGHSHLHVPGQQFRTETSLILIVCYHLGCVFVCLWRCLGQIWLAQGHSRLLGTIVKISLSRK